MHTIHANHYPDWENLQKAHLAGMSILLLALRVYDPISDRLINPAVYGSMRFVCAGVRRGCRGLRGGYNTAPARGFRLLYKGWRSRVV